MRRLGLMLTELRLPTIKRLVTDLFMQSDREGWPGHRLLESLLEHEMAEREARRSERHRAECKLWCWLALLLLGPTMSQAIEEPAYEVVQKLGESVEIRRYTAMSWPRC